MSTQGSCLILACSLQYAELKHNLSSLDIFRFRYFVTVMESFTGILVTFSLGLLNFAFINVETLFFSQIPKFQLFSHKLSLVIPLSSLSVQA